MAVVAAADDIRMINAADGFPAGHHMAVIALVRAGNMQWRFG